MALAQTPTIKSIQNAASNLPVGLPNSGVAQGSIVAIYGTNLGPSTLVVASGAWTSTLAGTSAAVTIGGQTVNLLIYYTSAGQVGAWLPDNTPTGTGTVKVTYTGGSVTAPVTVIQNGIGIFTWNQNGAGEAILSYNSDYSLVTTTKAANAGDVLDLWATGLGPVSGSEPTSGDMPSIPLKVWVGGVAANVLYRGRSGYIGEDQIAFTVPSGVTGCQVPVVLQINNYVSNTTTMPISASGRVCTPTNSALSSTTLQQLVGKSQVSVGGVSLTRGTSVTAGIAGLPSTTTKSDTGSASFTKISVSGDQLLGFVGTTSIGACTVAVYTSETFSALTGYTYTSLDAGASIAVSGPNGSRTLAKNTSGGSIVYSATLGNGTPGNYLDAGSYTVTGPGGADVGSFSASVNIPTALVWTNQSSITTVNRASGVTVTWTGGDSASLVEVVGASYSIDASENVALGVFTCYAPVAAQTFTVPPPVLLALPASSTVSGFTIPGSLSLYNSTAPVLFSASGLDYGFLSTSVTSSITPTYQ
jgi:uncharacterized protein (TIGR03437 family)